jgi:hypothetical protein
MEEKIHPKLNRSMDKVVIRPSPKHLNGRLSEQFLNALAKKQELSS